MKYFLTAAFFFSDLSVVQLSCKVQDVCEVYCETSTYEKINKFEIKKMEEAQPRQFQDISDIDLYVGREFKTFDEFKNVLRNRKALFGDDYNGGNGGGRTVDSYNKVIDSQKLHLPKHLKYAEYKMVCPRSGTHIPKAVLGSKHVNRQKK